MYWVSRFSNSDPIWVLLVPAIPDFFAKTAPQADPQSACGAVLAKKSDFTLTMVYLNPALNNTAPKFKLLLCFLTFSHVLKQSISFMKLFNRSYTDIYQPGKI